VINPFDTPALLEELNHILDRRLSGEIPSQQAILLVIDEMARLAKMECFDTLVTFLERCTEETRKANITFIGGSHKWTARHFKGRADIRACMNSMLIHKTKPSQADLLLEDAQDKHLVKHIQHPGEAILVTDYDVPNLVSIPFCGPQDMQAVATMLNQNTAKATPSTGSSSPEPEHVPGAAQENQQEQKRVETTQQRPQSFEAAKEALPHYSSEVIPFDCRRKSSLTLLQGRLDPKQITHEMLQEQLQLRKEEDDSLTQAEIARRVGVSQSYLSRLLHGKIPLKDTYRQKLYDILFEQHHTSNQKHPTSSRALWGKKKIAL
jgi:hypothetical protein